MFTVDSNESPCFQHEEVIVADVPYRCKSDESKPGHAHKRLIN